MNDLNDLYSDEIEYAIIGALILDENTEQEDEKPKSKAYYKALERLKPSYFYEPSNRAAFKQIINLHKKGCSPDDAIMRAQLLAECTEEFDEEGIEEYFDGFQELSQTKLNDYVETIIELWGKRKIIKEYDKLQEQVSLGQISIDEMLVQQKKVAEQIEGTRSKEVASRTYKDMKRGLLEKMKKNAESGSTVTGLSTGYKELDELTCGLQDSDLIIIAGRPSMGKTTLACNIMDNIASTGKRTLTFSIEMPGDQLLLRSWASVGTINQTALRTGRLNELEQGRLSAAIDKVDLWDAHVIDDGKMNIQQIVNEAKKLHEESPISAIMLDYLQLMKLPENNSKADAIGEVSRELKHLAGELGVPIIVLSQLSRNLENRQDKRPINSDLRDSGAIEQDADLILFVYRDEVYNPDSEDKGFAEIIIGKQRNGPLGTVKVKFEGQYSRFIDIPETEKDDPVEDYLKTAEPLDLNSATSPL